MHVALKGGWEALLEGRIFSLGGVEEEMGAGVTGQAERFDSGAFVARRENLLAVDLLAGRVNHQLKRLRLDILGGGGVNQCQGGQSGGDFHLCGDCEK
ncbi:hypothetical protein N7474_003158 [Penicillium riverlandense]|uniref:uncharacterized protein n=1 Tax=Penicillium riverlandense TaxID=1903569 RepID=UPI0025466AB7|nr:uncharacterized protein N7474_003158 [Penicillium riverlandense]KAJ5826020.1 hypothetical protein N7474_003158 [Penicillium riverlandense]